MLDIHEAAVRAGMSEAWLYRHHGTLPFAKKIGRKVVFSEQGLARWLALRRR
jgi:predicted DNA-binding transcriptional regulator AlpA